MLRIPRGVFLLVWQKHMNELNFANKMILHDISKEIEVAHYDDLCARTGAVGEKVEVVE